MRNQKSFISEAKKRSVSPISVDYDDRVYRSLAPIAPMMIEAGCES
jgi:hypothetical protein